MQGGGFGGIGGPQGGGQGQNAPNAPNAGGAADSSAMVSYSLFLSAVCFTQICSRCDTADSGHIQKLQS